MKLAKLGVGIAAMLLAACGGDDGATGPAGANGAQGPAGPEGPAAGGSSGTTGAANVNGLSPARAVLGRTSVIQISGNGTTWAEAPTVDFGEGVEVQNVEVSSPGALIVTIATDPEAIPGERTVKVGDLTFAGFQVLPGFSINNTLGDIAQGSVFTALIVNNDPENPFNDSFDLFSGGYTNFVIAGRNGTAVGGPIGINVSNVIEVTATTALVDFVTDVDVAAGKIDLVAQNVSLANDQDFSFSNDALDIVARAATEVPAAGFSGAAPSATTGASILLKGTWPTGGFNYGFDALPAGDAPTDAGLEVTALGSTGKYGAAGGSRLVKAGEVSYAIIRNNGAVSTAFNFTAEATVGVEAFIVDEAAEGNETKETAVSFTSLPAGSRGVLGGATDVDWYSFSPTVGEPVFVTALSQESSDEATATVYSTDGTTALVADADGLYNFTAAGTYYVKVENPAGAAFGKYDLVVWNNPE